MNIIRPHILVCANQLGYIGKDEDLMYHIKADMERFKRMTTNNVVIMGRKTLDSLPKGKPLKNRMNYVITRNDELLKNETEFDNLQYVGSLDEALIRCINEHPDKSAYIIGGAQIYKEAIDRDLYSVIHLTMVKDKQIGDTKIELNFFDVYPIGDQIRTYKSPEGIYYKYLTLINNK